MANHKDCNNKNNHKDCKGCNDGKDSKTHIELKIRDASQRLMLALLCDDYQHADLIYKNRSDVCTYCSRDISLLCKFKKYKAVEYILDRTEEYQGTEENTAECLKYMTEDKQQNIFVKLQQKLLPYDNNILNILFTDDYMSQSQVLFNFIKTHQAEINGYEDDMAVISTALTSPLKEKNKATLLKYGISNTVIEQVKRSIMDD